MFLLSFMILGKGQLTWNCPRKEIPANFPNPINRTGHLVYNNRTLPPSTLEWISIQAALGTSYRGMRADREGKLRIHSNTVLCVRRSCPSLKPEQILAVINAQDSENFSIKTWVFLQNQRKSLILGIPVFKSLWHETMGYFRNSVNLGVVPSTGGWQLRHPSEF